MHRLKERFRRLKRKPQHSDGDASLLDASTAQDGKNWTDASVLPKVVPKSASLAEQLWDRAYDELKADEAEATLVQAYERVLSLHLHDRALASDGDVDQENRIAQDDPGARRVQMKQLVTAGLAKIEREAKIKENVEKSVQVILQAKEIISSAISTIPQAALPWAGVCVALEATRATKANGDGIEYVIQRMKWYWELPETILRERANAYGHLSKMRGELEAQLISLYKLLLLYQMKSVCSYYKHRGLVFLRDIAKLDDWDGDIKTIEKAEAIFYKDSDVHRKEKMNANLEQIVHYVERKMTRDDLQCFQDLGITDPRYDKKRIENTKGGLLVQSYRWILDNPGFQKWRHDQETRLLWIRGDPGKGKTMLLCGIADELCKPSPYSGPMSISYFFCQATDQRINNADAVLWGLMFMLVSQQPELMHHIRSKYDKDLFSGKNSWYALSEIFSAILRDPALTRAYLLIDALDECTSGREKLLDLVIENLPASSRVKWIVSSRNWPEIERRLAASEGLGRVSLSLEVNADLVSRAVDAYIEHEVARLHLIKHHPTLKDRIQHEMRQKANGTFLWVALVVKDLRDRDDAEYDDPSNILNILMEMPGDLPSLYSLMVDHIVKQGDTPRLCKRILSVAALASRPLSLAELRILAGFDRNHIGDPAMERLISKCGSFLTTRDSTVYFIHQSAKDHLTLDEPTQPILFSSGQNEIHRAMFSHSLRAMVPILKKNMYALPHPGSRIDEVETPDPDPLAAIRYSCAYWIDHFRNAMSDNACPTYQKCLDDMEVVSAFLHTKFLHWLEALSLLQKVSDIVTPIRKLASLLKTQLPQTPLVRFLQDGYRFVLYFIRAIESAPLQVYSSALVFSPMQSLVRQTFHGRYKSWVLNRLNIDDNWSPCLQIIDGHASAINCIAFSGDSKLATGSADKTVKIWDIATGACLRTLLGQGNYITSLSFLKKHTLASGSSDGVIKIWDIATGKCIQTINGRYRASIAALTENKLASGSSDKTVRVWDTVTGLCLQTLTGHAENVTSVTALTGNRLASGSQDKTARIWDTATGVCIRILEGHSGAVAAVAALAGNKLISGSDDKTIKVWDTATGSCLQTLTGHADRVTAVTALTDNRLASGSSDKTARIWDTATGACIQILEGHNSNVTSITAFKDNELASGSHDKTIRIWDTATGLNLQKLEGHGGWVRSVAISGDRKQAASASDDGIVKIWDIAGGTCVQTLIGHNSWVGAVAFSADGKQLASGSFDGVAKIWDTAGGTCVQTLIGHSGRVMAVTFSRDGRQLASGSDDETVKIWDTATGMCIHTLEGHSGWVMAVAFSTDGRQLASGSDDETVKIWDTATGMCIQTLEGHSSGVMAVTFSRDGRRLASGSDDKTIKIWDAAAGVCVQTLPTGVAIDQLSFDEEKGACCLYTNLGILRLDPEQAANKTVSETAVICTGYGINMAGSWVTRDGKPLLLLPAEYRPRSSIVVGSTVVLGSKAGRVLALQLSEQDGLSV